MYDYFYRNPRVLILATCLILVAGLSSLMLLPRMEDPVLTQRVASVNTVFPGANAERVESLVTEPIEDALREIKEIKEVRSRSRSGISLITVTLADRITKVDTVWAKIRDKIGDTSPQLPPDAMEPEFRELEMKAYAAIYALVWEQDDAPNFAILRRHAETLKDRFLAVSGTEKIRIFGAPDEEFIATVDSAQIASMGVTSFDIANAVRRSDAKSSAGQLRGEQFDFLLEVDGEMNSLDRIGRTPIKSLSDGRQVRLEDVATIEKTVTTPQTSATIIDGKVAITMGLLVREEERLDLWASRVQATFDQYCTELPVGIQLKKVFEQNRYVDARLGALLSNLLLGVAGVMLVIFLIMGWRSALIVGVALPLSSLMVLTGMRLLEIPVHQMSITGLIIAIGLLIDNAIVMVDEVRAELDKGVPAGKAVNHTVRHLAIPLLGSTITTALAFAPIALMPGPAGEFVGSIAISVMLAIFSSLMVSMTIVPALTAFGISGKNQNDTETQLPTSSPRRTTEWLSHGIYIHWLRVAYAKSLRMVLGKPWLGVAMGVTAPILGFLVASQLPEQFFPPADRDQFQIELELPSQASMASTMQLTCDVRKFVLKHPQVDAVQWFVGESAPAFYYNVIARRQNAANYAQALVQLNALEGSRETIHELQDALDLRYPQARILVRQLEQGPPFDAPVEIRVFGPNFERLRALGDEVRNRLARIPNVLHTRADLSESITKIALVVDEEQSQTVGLDHDSISRQLQTSLEGVNGGSVLESTEELPIRIRLASSTRSQLNKIASLELTSPSSLAALAQPVSIPLTAIADVKLKPETATIPHRNSERINEVQAYIPAGVLPASVLAEFRESVEEHPIEMPPGYRLEFGGEAAERDNAVGNLLSSVGILLVLMAATLVLSFGSFRVSGIVASVAGLSMGLGLLALWVFGYPFGFMAIIGSMGLMGVAINDAIVILAGIQANSEARAGDREAIHQVVEQSTRHIIATSLTTMAGFAPLVVAGGEFWPPMAVAISGGVAGATILALYFVPSAYLLLNCKNCVIRS